MFQPVGAFYQPPQPLPAGKPGDLIRSQAMPSPTGFQAWRILYHSRDGHGADIAVSGFVVADTSVAAPTGGRAALGYAHGVRGLANQCAPSNSTNPLQDLAMYTPALAAGAVLVATDYPGLGAPGQHPYLVGKDEAHSVLDALRAARHLSDLHMNNNVVLLGDTQGGHAALFAGQIAPTYAPEDHIIGIAVEDPVTDPLALARHAATGQYGVEFVLEATVGYTATDPSANLDDIVTPTGVNDLRLLQNECDDEFGRDSAGQSVTQVFRTDPLTTPPWSTGLAANAAGTTTTTTAPLLIIQGTSDETYPSTIVDQFVKHVCALGANVDYRTFPDIGHAITITSAPQVLQWIIDRIVGRPAASNCH